jgi:hydrogenase expression/formation protein HypC
MCLAVPAKLIKRDLAGGTVDMNGNQVDVCTILVPDAKEGDWVLVHAGFAIQTVSEEDARETWAVISQLEPPEIPEFPSLAQPEEKPK